MVESKPKFGYWNIRGLGNNLRFQLAFHGVDYEEKRYPFGPPPDFNREEWVNEKMTLGLPFPNLPHYIDGEVRLTETLSIHKYLAEKHCPDLCGKTPKEKAELDMVARLTHDGGKVKMVNKCFEPGSEKSVCQEYALKEVERLVTYLGDKKFIMGDNLTWLDFYNLEFYEWLNWFTEGAYFKKYPKAEEYAKRLSELPGVKEYRASDKYLAKPFLPPFA
mmetsp:Transcript_26877/g.25931  ORF Transcript_26877/g.25931 Transcript_26877/m.25931 type:complete len:219 (-) Transcript_26877:77-733(-)